MNWLELLAAAVSAVRNGGDANAAVAEKIAPGYSQLANQDDSGKAWQFNAGNAEQQQYQGQVAQPEQSAGRQTENQPTSEQSSEEKKNEEEKKSSSSAPGVNKSNKKNLFDIVMESVQQNNSDMGDGFSGSGGGELPVDFETYSENPFDKTIRKAYWDDQASKMGEAASFANPVGAFENLALKGMGIAEEAAKTSPEIAKMLESVPETAPAKVAEKAAKEAEEAARKEAGFGKTLDEMLSDAGASGADEVKDIPIFEGPMTLSQLERFNDKVARKAGKGKDAPIFRPSDPDFLQQQLKALQAPGKYAKGTPKEKAEELGKAGQKIIQDSLLEAENLNGIPYSQGDLSRALKYYDKIRNSHLGKVGPMGMALATLALGGGTLAETLAPEPEQVRPSDKKESSGPIHEAWKTILDKYPSIAGPNASAEGNTDAAAQAMPFLEGAYGLTADELMSKYEDEIYDAAMADKAYRTLFDNAGYGDQYGSYAMFGNLGDTTNYDSRRDVTRDIFGLNEGDNPLEIKGLQQIYKENGIINDKMSNEEKLEAILDAHWGAEHIIDPYQWLDVSDYEKSHMLNGTTAAGKYFDYWLDNGYMPLPGGESLDDLLKEVTEGKLDRKDVVAMINAGNLINQINSGVVFDPTTQVSPLIQGAGDLAELSWLDDSDEDSMYKNWEKNSRNRDYSAAEVGRSLLSLVDPKIGGQAINIYEPYGIDADIADVIASEMELNDRQHRSIGRRTKSE